MNLPSYSRSTNNLALASDPDPHLRPALAFVQPVAVP